MLPLPEVTRVLLVDEPLSLLLDVVLPALVLEAESVEEPLWEATTIAPAPASEVSTAPPAITARTLPTRRVLRVRLAARCSAVGSGSGR